MTYNVKLKMDEVDGCWLERENNALAGLGEISNIEVCERNGGCYQVATLEVSDAARAEAAMDAHDDVISYEELA
jgi:hypothetical protein